MEQQANCRLMFPATGGAEGKYGKRKNKAALYRERCLLHNQQGGFLYEQ